MVETGVIVGTFLSDGIGGLLVLGGGVELDCFRFAGSEIFSCSNRSC
jgi:hypothetical protein